MFCLDFDLNNIPITKPYPKICCYVLDHISKSKTLKLSSQALIIRDTKALSFSLNPKPLYNRKHTFSTLHLNSLTDNSCFRDFYFKTIFFKKHLYYYYY